MDDEMRRRLLADPDPQGPAVEVVIDTDVTNEIDDQFAIVWALLRQDRLRIRGLHACPWASSPDLYLRPDMDTPTGRVTEPETTHRAEHVGPAEGVERAAQQLRRIVALTGRDDVPVRKGSAAFLDDARTPVDSEATDALIALAHEDRKGPLYVAAIGCATNFASAVLRDPSIAERIVVVWTSAYPSFWPRPNVSYNLSLDLHASRALLDSGVPLVYLPGYYVGEELRVGRLELEANVRGHGALGDYLWECWDSHWMSDSRDPAFSKVIWDLICVAWLINPRWLSTDLVATPLLDDELRWRQQPGRPVMREAFDVDRDAIFRDLYRALAHVTGE
ncbi:MAG: nucleoside hydrolase [Actinomycetales bacterium]